MQQDHAKERGVKMAVIALSIGLLLGAGAIGKILLDARADTHARAHAQLLLAMRDAIVKEEVGMLSAVAGDTSALTGVVVAHQDFLVATEGAVQVMPEKATWIESVRAEEKALTESLLTEGDRTGMFDRLAKAKADFLDKNNKHIARLSGYRASWVTPLSARDKEVALVLDGIRAERNLVDAFSPADPEREKVIIDFRAKNDFVVSELIRFWNDEVDRVLPRIPKGASKDVFTACRAIYPLVTSTTFPALSDADSTLFQISAPVQLTGKDAETATVKLYERLDREVETLEKQNIKVWSRHAVPNVGDNVTPNKTLGEIIKCQQGLRINAEDIFALRTALNDDIRPRYVALVNSVNKEVDATTRGVGVHDRIALILGIASLLAFLFALTQMFVVWKISARSPTEAPPVQTTPPTS